MGSVIPLAVLEGMDDDDDGEQAEELPRQPTAEQVEDAADSKA